MPTRQEQKKDKQLLAVIVIIVVVAGAIILLRSRGVFPAGSGSARSHAVRTSVERIRQQINIPQNFFTDKVLEAFTPYEPAKPPADAGRENPFAPL